MKPRWDWLDWYWLALCAAFVAVPVGIVAGMAALVWWMVKR